MKKRSRSMWVVTIGMLCIAGIMTWRSYDSTLASPQSSPPPSMVTPITPQATPTPTPVFTVTPSPQPTIAVEVNLQVPFTAQAPHANWKEPYAELCEEASALMAASYVQGIDIPNPTFVDENFLAIKAFEEQRFGYYEDTTAEETAIILREYYKIPNVELVKNPTVQDIQLALTNKKLVIVPAAGQQLHNPNFKPPGPLYHMLIIKGYTPDGQFITNDPGTRRGADFMYDQDVIMNAMHDWRADRNIELGQKIVIVVG